MNRTAHGVALALALLTAGVSGAQTAPSTAPGALPMLSVETPLQCWWRMSSGAIHVGEVVDVTLSCAVLETPTVRAVPDESRLSVAAVQLMPFEIVGGSHPPDLRQDDRRLFQYVYQLRLLDADVIGQDVKLPPLAIPYRIQSQTSADTSLAGRDLTHLMPQLAIRVVSQVPAEAEDIRDGAQASLGRIESLRFRANAFRAAALVLGALGALAGLGALAPLVGRLRTRRTTVPGGVSDRLVLNHAVGVLDRLARTAAGSGWTPETLAEAHGAVRVLTAAVMRDGVRQRRLDPRAAVPEGRLQLTQRLRRARFALTAHVTADAVGRAIAAMPAAVSSTERSRLERLRDCLDALTRAQYVAGAVLDDRGSIDEAVGTARDIARDVARERLWSPRDWFRSVAPVSPARGA